MSSRKGKNVVVDDPEHLSRAAAQLSVGDDGGEWQVNSRKPKPNRPAQPAVQQAWGRGGPTARGGGPTARGNGPTTGGNGRTARGNGPTTGGNGPTVRGGHHPPPLQHGWNWPGRPGSQNQPPPAVSSEEEKEENGVESEEEESEEELLSDEFDSDSSEKSHNTLKRSNWFLKFFKTMDELELDEVNDVDRQWHCPACQNGPGSIDWYCGLQPLMTHAKTKGGKRMKLHRRLAELLDEELRRKGTSVAPHGETFGLWKGLEDQEKDHAIVWPPMIIIMNTRLTQDDNGKWTGMGNQELLEYFSPYTPTRARHSYGPQGHRGMSLLVFEASARGYLEAERLHKRFISDNKDRNAWVARRTLLSGGMRQLYGYLATKDDLTAFNQHSHGKTKVKFEMKSYHETVVNQLKQMSEDNQQLSWFKDKFNKEKIHSKAVEESLSKVSQKLFQTMEENRIVRLRTKLQHQENKEEMYLQEEFFKEQMKIVQQTRDANEESFEELQQEERKKAKKLSTDTSSSARQRTEEISKFIESQDKEMEDYVLERESLIKAQEEKMKAMRKRHLEQELELEKQFTAELAALMHKYNPNGQA